MKADEKGPTCADFLERALNYFADRGIPSVPQLMTDNAWAYTWSLRGVCTSIHLNAANSALGGHPPVSRLLPT